MKLSPYVSIVYEDILIIALKCITNNFDVDSMALVYFSYMSLWTELRMRSKDRFMYVSI